MMKWADKFCARHPRFGIQNLMLYIVVGNALVYLFAYMDSTYTLIQMLSFNPALILKGEVWRLISFIIIPQSDNPFLFMMYLYLYYIVGKTLEYTWGAGRLTIYYFTGIILSAVFGFVFYFTTGISFILTAGFINLSLFFCYGTLYPDNVFLVFFIIPVKAKWLALLEAALFIYQIISLPFPSNLFPIIAAFNYVMFCGYDLMLRPLISRFSHSSGNTVNYKRAAKKIRRDMKNKPYTRKCSVCGRTDTDYPELSFRYCSRCSGYHCFCEEHIGNHVHFTE